MKLLKILTYYFTFSLFSFQILAQEHKPLPIKKMYDKAPEKRLDYLFDLRFSWGSEVKNLQRLDSIMEIAVELKDVKLQQYIFTQKVDNYLMQAPTLKAKDSVTAKYLPVVEKTFGKEAKADFNFWVGNDAFIHNNFKKALKYLFMAKLVLDAPKVDTSQRHTVIYYKRFSNIYLYHEDYATAAAYCKKLAEVSDDRYRFYERYRNYNNWGLYLLKLNNFSEAEVVFKKGYELAIKSGNISYAKAILGNIGNLYCMTKQYKKALPLLYEDMTYNAQEDGYVENAAISKIYLANALIHLDSVQKAKQFLSPPNFQIPPWMGPRYTLFRLQTLALYYEKVQDFKKVLQYKDSLIIVEDSLKKAFDYKKIALLDSELQAERFKNEQKEFELNAKNEKIIRNGIIFFLVFIFSGIVAWMIYHRKKQNELLLQKEKLAEEKLLQANLQLEQFLQSNKEKNELIEQMTLELQQTNAQSPELLHQAQNYLDKLQKSVILTEDNWLDFKRIFEKIHPQFFSRLLYEFPEVSPAETRLVALNKLGLSNKEMANMLGISIDAIKKAKYRLRKKYPELLGEKIPDTPDEPDEA